MNDKTSSGTDHLDDGKKQYRFFVLFCFEGTFIMVLPEEKKHQWGDHLLTDQGY